VSQLPGAAWTDTLVPQDFHMDELGVCLPSTLATLSERAVVSGEASASFLIDAGPFSHEPQITSRRRDVLGYSRHRTVLAVRGTLSDLGNF